MSIFDDELPTAKKRNPPQVGEDLSRHSEEELTERIQQLRAEIEKTESELQKRSKIRSDADAVFKI